MIKKIKKAIKKKIEDVVENHKGRVAVRKDKKKKMNEYKKYLRQAVIDQENMVPSISGSTKMDDTYLFDFKNWNGGQNGNGVFFAPAEVNSSKESEKPVKISMKPIDVVSELETMPTPWSLTNLDEKIALLQAKEKMIKQEYSKREVTALLVRMENRKQYPLYREFFEGFQNTTEEKIDKILDKYTLVMKTSDIFVPEFPQEAIDVMQKYTKECLKLCGKEPVYYVIAEDKEFKKAYQKRDPILLVQSPFGFYYQILGAWDKEMVLLSEL